MLADSFTRVVLAIASSRRLDEGAARARESSAINARATEAIAHTTRVNESASMRLSVAGYESKALTVAYRQCRLQRRTSDKTDRD